MTEIVANLRERWRALLAVGLLLFALVVAIIGLADPRGRFRLGPSLFGPKEDGDWAALSIDGKAVPPFEFRVAVRDGRVAGGRDGCNDWAYASEPDARGERMIETTLQACPENELSRAYHIIAYDSEARLLPDGRLELAGRGHRAIFARCRWKDVKESGPGWTSQIARCVVE
jgi:hypothetical protein